MLVKSSEHYKQGFHAANMFYSGYLDILGSQI